MATDRTSVQPAPTAGDRGDVSRRFLVLVPTYNEAENISILLPRVLEQDPRLDVLVVDDSSPDGTGELVTKWATREPRIELLSRPTRLGLGTAFLAGLEHARARGYAGAITMDADFSHDPRFLPALLSRSGDADLVIGSRYTKGGSVTGRSLHRRALSRGANLYARWLLALPVHDCTGAFRCYGSRAVDLVCRSGVATRGYAALVEIIALLHRNGMTIEEVPIVFADRIHGVSKMSSNEILGGALSLVRVASRWRSSPAGGNSGGAGLH